MQDPRQLDITTEAADEGHVRITVRSIFDPTEPTAAADADVRAGLRSVAGILGRLAVHHFDGYGARQRNYPVIASERIAHGCGNDPPYKIKTHCTVTAAGLVDPYAVLRPDADPYGPLAVAPTVTFTVPAERAEVWRAALRETLRRITRIDEWVPTEEQRRLRMLVSHDDGPCPPNAISVESVSECDAEHWHFGVYSPDMQSLHSSHGSATGELRTLAAVYAGRREASCRMGRVAAEMAVEIDRVQVSHGCKLDADGDGCTIVGSELIDAIGFDWENDNPCSVVFRAQDETQAAIVAEAVRLLLAEVDAVDAGPVAPAARRTR